MDLKMGSSSSSSTEVDCHVIDVDSITDDMITMEKLLKRLQDGSEQIQTVHSATNMKELQAIMESDIDDVFIVAKSIKQCLESSKVSGSPVTSRMNAVMEIGKKLKEMMDGFQWLKLKISAAHKESVESVYYSVTKEKQSMETIEKFVGSGEIDTFLRVAGDEEGNVRILDVVQEIQERIIGAKYMQKCLDEVQTMFLDMVALVDHAHRHNNKVIGLQGGGGGGTEKEKRVVGGGGGGGVGVDNRKGGGGVTQLMRDSEDHERQAKKRATQAIIFTMFFIVILIGVLAKLESDNMEKE